MTASPLNRAWRWWAAGCAVLTLAYMPVLVRLAGLAVTDPGSSHLPLMPVVAAGLVLWRRREIFAELRPRPAIGFSVALAMAAAAIVMQAQGGAVLGALLATFVVACYGTFVGAFGWPAFRRALFPMALLLLTIPIPPTLLGWVTHGLVAGTAETVAVLFGVTGTPFYREGQIFTLPHVTLAIADECSGLRSTMALAIAGAVGSYVALEQAWSRTVFAAALVPVAILKNGIRITALALLSLHVDPGYLTGPLHHDGGIVFLLIAFVLLAPVLWILQRAEAHLPRLDPSGSTAPDPLPQRLSR